MGFAPYLINVSVDTPKFHMQEPVGDHVLIEMLPCSGIGDAFPATKFSLHQTLNGWAIVRWTAGCEETSDTPTTHHSQEIANWQCNEVFQNLLKIEIATRYLQGYTIRQMFDESKYSYLIYSGRIPVITPDQFRAARNAENVVI